MSTALCRRIWDRGPTGNGRFLLLCIGDHADESGHAYPSLERLAERCTMTKRSVISTLNILEKEGWLKRIKKGRKSEYQIVLAKLGIGEVSSSIALPTDEEHSRVTSEDASPVQAPIGEVERTEKVKLTAAIGEISCNPPTPPYRRTTKEPPYEPVVGTVAETSLALAARIAATESALQSESLIRAFAQAIESELKGGTSPGEAGKLPLSQTRRYIAARDSGKFEIRGWSIPNLLAGGHWRDEQCWHWKPEHRPERKMRYRDPATLYSGPEYQRRAEGA